MNGLDYKTTNNKKCTMWATLQAKNQQFCQKFKNASERRKTHFNALPIPTHYQGVKKPPRAKFDPLAAMF